MARYNALYSGFAAVPLFMIWIFLSWNTVLIGAEVAAAHEREPSLRGSGRLGGEGQTWRERLALRAAVRVAAAFAVGRKSLPIAVLASEMGVSQRQLQDVLAELVSGGVLVRATGRGRGYFPARDLSLIRVTDVLGAMRAGDPRVAARSSGGTDERADAALAALRGEIEASANNRTLRALVDEAPRA
jgi:membrane protein